MSTKPQNEYYYIPDLLAAWPWQRILNDALDSELEEEANNWVASLDLFAPRQLAMFKTCKFDLLAALAGPLCGRDFLRSYCDLINLLFAYDEYTDVVDGDVEATAIAEDVIKAFRGQETSSGNSKITNMARQFFDRTVKLVGNDVDGIAHFVEDFEAYVKSVSLEAEERNRGIIRSVEDHLTLRRNTSGGKACISFSGLGLYIPKEIFDHPVMQALKDNATDLIAITNDMHSYALEHARGLDGHNVITSVMHEHDINLQDALYWLSEYVNKIITKFLTDRESVPSWGVDVDNAVSEYIDRMARCVRGCDAWSYETRRYYGSHGLQVQEHRRITLQHPELEMGYVTRDDVHIGA